MIKALLLFSVFSITLNAQNVVYVSVNGNDNTGSGSVSSPYRTIQYALNQTSDNDTIILRGGTYSSNEIRINNNNITIKSFDGEWAVIQASTDIEDVTSCIWYHEPTIVGGRLERLEIIGGYLYGIKLESDWNWGTAIPDRHGTRDITISRCKIHDTGRDCIKMPSGCDNIIVENCTIFNSGIGVSNNPDDPNAEGIDMVNNDNVIIRNNYVHNTSTTGIYSKGGSINVLIENNLVMNTGESGILLGFYTDEEWFDTIANPDFYENISGIARNNIIINTNLDGIGLYAAYNPQVYNNTVINAAQNDHAALFFNTGYMWLDKIQDMIAPPCVDVFVANNIFTVSSARPNAQIRYYEEDISSNMQGNCIVDNNLYYKDGGAVFDDGIDWQLLNLTDWQNSTTFDLNTLEADPLINTNYHLSLSSPCINMGSDVADLSIDYDGNTRVLPFDIGADEYDAGTNLKVPPDDNSLGTGGGSSSSVFNTAINHVFKLYPNPANSMVSVSFEADKLINSHLSIIDMNGKLIKEFNINSVEVDALNRSEFHFQIDDLDRGVYFIVISNHNATSTHKLLIER